MNKKIILFLVGYVVVGILVTLLYSHGSGVDLSSKLVYERGFIITFLLVGTPVLFIHFKRFGWRPVYLKKR